MCKPKVKRSSRSPTFHPVGSALLTWSPMRMPTAGQPETFCSLRNIVFSHKLTSLQHPTILSSQTDETKKAV